MLLHSKLQKTSAKVRIGIRKLVQRLPACKIKVLDSVPGIFELCDQFVFACRKEKTTHREVALDLSPTTVTGTAV
ncbi:hypothetical protein BDA96_01G485400 [Sorghum bicolor]|jgi:hypothetical protein|uniref:Uncharacterized protein n=2 Tax=Sorghum bicolor TaxID=4558 RepID=A0A921V143_SORBI|nr:hypothetical protein BDA96_01G485400 [Sorghum bicolor]KXG39857.1 hypothetical protein SORBI_3001G455400 [Sorghum bicolor]